MWRWFWWWWKKTLKLRVLWVKGSMWSKKKTHQHENSYAHAVVQYFCDDEKLLRPFHPTTESHTSHRNPWKEVVDRLFQRTRRRTFPSRFCHCRFKWKWFEFALNLPEWVHLTLEGSHYATRPVTMVYHIQIPTVSQSMEVAIEQVAVSLQLSDRASVKPCLSLTTPC